MDINFTPTILKYHFFVVVVNRSWQKAVSVAINAIETVVVDARLAVIKEQCDHAFLGDLACVGRGSFVIGENVLKSTLLHTIKICYIDKESSIVFDGCGIMIAVYFF